MVRKTVLFVSGLNAGEFALLPSFRSLGIVSSSVVHTNEDVEPAEVSRALKAAARRQSGIIAQAQARLQDQAAQRGATAVLGVTIRRLRLTEELWEYAMTGTAVCEAGAKPAAKPVVCTLSGPDFLMLMRGGYRPVGFVFGVGIYSQKLHMAVQREAVQGLNTERSDFTVGLYRARRHAFEALHQDAAALKAEGILAIHVGTERTLHGGPHFSDRMVIGMVASGTAVVSCPRSELEMKYAVPLADGKNAGR